VSGVRGVRCQVSGVRCQVSGARFILVRVQVAYLLVSLMLMYGSVKGSRWFLLPWLVATLLFILAYMVGMCLSTVLFGLSVLSLAFLAIAIVEVM
jgi:hypothetical protein